MLLWAAVANKGRVPRQHAFWIDRKRYEDEEKKESVRMAWSPKFDFTVVSLCGRSYERLGSDRRTDPTCLPEGMTERPICTHCLRSARQVERVIYAAVSYEEAIRVVIDWTKNPNSFNSTPPLFMAAVLTDTIRDTRDHASSWHSAIEWPKHESGVKW